MAVGTGFGQLFRSVGQVCVSNQKHELFSSHSVKVGGVAVSSAVFQSVLDSELRKRIRGPDANEVSSILSRPAIWLIGIPPDDQADSRICETRRFLATGFAEGRARLIRPNSEDRLHHGHVLDPHGIYCAIAREFCRPRWLSAKSQSARRFRINLWVTRSPLVPPRHTPLRRKLATLPVPQ
jgi:hypothetical protein